MIPKRTSRWFHHHRKPEFPRVFYGQARAHKHFSLWHWDALRLHQFFELVFMISHAALLVCQGIGFKIPPRLTLEAVAELILEISPDLYCFDLYSPSSGLVQDDQGPIEDLLARRVSDKPDQTENREKLQKFFPDPIHLAFQSRSKNLHWPHERSADFLHIIFGLQIPMRPAFCRQAIRTIICHARILHDFADQCLRNTIMRKPTKLKARAVADPTAAPNPA